MTLEMHTIVRAVSDEAWHLIPDTIVTTMRAELVRGVIAKGLEPRESTFNIRPMERIVRPVYEPPMRRFVRRLLGRPRPTYAFWQITMEVFA